jgi:hypothetical protein
MKKYITILLSAFFLIMLAPEVIKATTISPFKNLGEMAKVSEVAVFAKAIRNYQVNEGAKTYYRTEFQVLDIIKGKISEQFYTQKIAITKGDMHQLVFGESKFEEGEKYLLMLSKNHGFWRPLMLSHGVFKQKIINNEKVLVPIDEGMIISNTENQDIESFQIYKTKELCALLKEVAAGVKAWNSDTVQANYSLKRYRENFRAAPDHCSFLGSPAPYPRWPNFETEDLPVYYHIDGEAGCSAANNIVKTAISRLNNNYIGINLSDGGTHNFIPDCLISPGDTLPEGAADGEFASGISRRTRVIYNDPCEEIMDLSGCSGILAFGGLYWFGSTHTWDGIGWNDAAYGYVIINNGVGDCNCSENFTTLLVHELTHTLGIGHIDESAGVANMNPECCKNISSLDQECLDFTYLTGTLPAELVSFEGILNDKVVDLKWETKNEINNDGFEIERSINDGSFISIKSIPSRNKNSLSYTYATKDHTPGIGQNTYRLIQIDLDGRRNQVGDLVTVNFKNGGEVKVFPNPIKNNLLFIEFYQEDKGTVDFQLVDVSGHVSQTLKYNLKNGRNSIQWNLDGLPKGMYFLRSAKSDFLMSEKILIM